MDFTLISMLALREGASHSPTPKPTLLFNWTGATKRPFIVYVCREQQKQTLGRVMKSYWRCDIPIGQFTLFLRMVFLDDLYFFSYVSFAQWSSDSLAGCLYSPEKMKRKPCPNPNFREVPFLASYI